MRYELTWVEPRHGWFARRFLPRRKRTRVFVVKDGIEAQAIEGQLIPPGGCLVEAQLEDSPFTPGF